MSDLPPVLLSADGPSTPTADEPSTPIQCLLAFDHDGCGRFVGENASNGQPPKALETLVELLQKHIGPAGKVEYTLASYSNRQSETINKLMNTDVSGANPRVELTDDEKGRINLHWLSKRIKGALKAKGLTENAAVYDHFFLEEEMNKKRWTDKRAFKAWCEENKKADLRAAIRAVFPPGEGQYIVYLDDHCLNVPTKEEAEAHPQEKWVHFAPLTGVVEWMKCQ